MAIAVNGFATGAANGGSPGASGLTFNSHVLSSNARRIVIVAASFEGADQVPTDVTLDGVSMGTAEVSQVANAGNNYQYKMLQADLPAGGSAYSVVITGLDAAIIAGTIGIDDAKQQAAEHTATWGANSGSAFDVPIVSVTTDALVIVYANSDSALTTTWDTATELFDRNEPAAVDSTGAAAWEKFASPSSNEGGDFSGSRRHSATATAWEEDVGGGGADIRRHIIPAYMRMAA